MRYGRQEPTDQCALVLFGFALIQLLEIRAMSEVEGVEVEFGGHIQ